LGGKSGQKVCIHKGWGKRYSYVPGFREGQDRVKCGLILQKTYKGGSEKRNIGVGAIVPKKTRIGTHIWGSISYVKN